MADRPFQVIEGGGKPEPDADLVRGRKEAAVALETAESFWLLIEDAEGMFQVMRYGDALVQSAMVEEMGRARKMEALGLWGDDE